MRLQLDPRRVRYALFVVFLAAFTYLLFLAAPLVWSVLQVFILIVLLALALHPAVRWLTHRRVPRWAAVSLIYVLVLLTAVTVLFFAVPVLVEQVTQFSTQEVPTLYTRFTATMAAFVQQNPQFSGLLDISSLTGNLGGWFASLARVAQTVFFGAIGAVTGLILVVITTFYLLLDPWPLLCGVRGLFPTSWWPTIDTIAVRLGERIQGWVLGTLTLAVIIGLLDYLGLTLVNWLYGPDLPYVILFALLGGLLEVIPVVGPTIAAVLPTALALTVDPVLALIVLGVFVLIQALENYVIVPLVMRQAVDLHPVSLIFTLVILSGLFGLFGAIIAVPVAATIKVLYDEWYYPLVHGGEHPLPARPPEVADAPGRPRDDRPEAT